MESKPQASSGLLSEWEKPRVALVLSGRQHGYIEPCGCTGLENQKGGLARRYTLLQTVRERGWDVMALDVGNQVRRYGAQAQIKYRSTIEALKRMHYQGIGFGPDDLRLSLDELIAVAVDTSSGPQPFVCANANLLGFNDPFRIVERQGIRFGITSVLGATYAAQVNNAAIEIRSAKVALRTVVAAMQAKKCDVMILLAHATLSESEELAKLFPHFQLVVSAAGAGEPPHQLRKIDGARGYFAEIGTKGMHVGVIGFYGEPSDLQIRYERVALDSSFADAPEMIDSLAGYQQQLKALGLEGLGVQPLEHASGHHYVGSQACAECHADEYEIWAKSKHAHATDSISHPAERSEVPRHFDPECLSCHVTGWNPQEFVPFRTGYVDLKSSAHLTGSGCENCHGPGSAHVAVENGEVEASESQRLKWQREMHVEKSARKCMECHDYDNSPDFHKPGAFDRYWSEIAHGQ